MKSMTASVGSGKYIVEATAVFCGKDINITIGGGESYHIGAVAIAEPGIVITNGKKRCATTSVICLMDHKEDELARYAARHLASVLDCVVTVSAGIHIDNISVEEIKIFDEIFKQLINQLEKSLAAGDR
ncbi:hypothetical protein [Ammoniphilus resinae]|uniref:Prenylated flavin chaperone LpdD-like domain-containing protein n=1 Tax=Ammoniphilus resinae TaxID=861532 RepID=A0ABS4GIP9_9BACL|nr:hypothetical protein [Ammoniphilus resinae]MBP1930119.1 hypothetical protein [Ammoniphilus resinae]